MKKAIKCLGAVLLALGIAAFIPGGGKEGRMPWRQAGLTERQAAAHLISRFTYGAAPGQVDAVVKEGLENWFRQQLEARQPDDSLDQLLSGYDALKLSNAEIAGTYP